MCLRWVPVLVGQAMHSTARELSREMNWSQKVEVLDSGTLSSDWDDERRVLVGMYSSISSLMYSGASPWMSHCHILPCVYILGKVLKAIQV